MLPAHMLSGASTWPPPPRPFVRPVIHPWQGPPRAPCSLRRRSGGLLPDQPSQFPRLQSTTRLWRPRASGQTAAMERCSQKRGKRGGSRLWLAEGPLEPTLATLLSHLGSFFLHLQRPRVEGIHGRRKRMWIWAPCLRGHGSRETEPLRVIRAFALAASPSAAGSAEGRRHSFSLQLKSRFDLTPSPPDFSKKAQGLEGRTAWG